MPRPPWTSEPLRQVRAASNSPPTSPTSAPAQATSVRPARGSEEREESVLGRYILSFWDGGSTSTEYTS